MHDKALAEQKLQSALNLTENLIAGEWPYKDSSEALEAIANEFRRRLDRIRGLGDASPEIINHWCADARDLVARYHTFIGVILRSSNIRNAFESYDPIRSLARGLLGDDFKVIIGSEWSYTPFVYPVPIPSLENFIFVGLPASEAQNALLTPLAGHELGHALWKRTEVSAEIRNKVRDDIIQSYVGSGPGQSDLFPYPITMEEADQDLRLRSNWKKPFEFAIRQCEEIFCDVIACWLFGDSFIQAYRYLTVPDLKSRPTEYYPTNRTRAEILHKAGNLFHGRAFALHELFKTNTETQSSDIRLADEVSRSAVDLIIKTVDEFCNARAELKKPKAENIAACKVSLLRIQPAESLNTIADVICAAWQIRLDLNSWDIAGVNPIKKIDILNDLVFKSFEVNEIRRIDAEPQGLVDTGK